MKLILIQYSCHKNGFRGNLFENFTSHSSPIFLNLEIFKQHDLFQLELLTFVYDCANKLTPSYFHSFFALVESVHRYGTWQASKNDIFFTQTNAVQYGLRSVRYFGPKC